MIGTMIGQYRVLAKLGDGGMGTVYKALDVNLERPVALKLIHANIDARSGSAERFRAEARMHASLHHPNIATLYAFLVWEEKPVMVMEYIDGETLLDRIQRVGPVPVADLVPLMTQALLGLSAAHRQGIVHRDIKPQNLMVDRLGVLKVMDFGIAKMQGQKGLTGTNMAPGTLWYMAPEQIRNREIDARTDIYAMGVTLYQALTGKVPFDANSEFDIQRAHLEEIPESPRVLNPKLPRALADATLRALAKRPEDRFPSAEAFREALSIASAPGAQPGSGTVPEQSAYRGQTIFEPIVPVQKVTPAPTPTPAPVPARPASRGPLYVACAVLLAGGGGWAWYNSTHHDTAIKSEAATSARPTNGADTSPVASSPSPNLPVSHPNLPMAKQGRGPTLNGNLPGTLKAGAGTGIPKHAPPPAPPGPEPKPSSPVIAAGRELSGMWTGNFVDPIQAANAPAGTHVSLQLEEDSPSQLRGSLQFITPSQDRGSCQVSPRHSSFDASTGVLVLSLTSCNGADTPPFFRTPVQFQGVSPTSNQLRGGHPTLSNTRVTANLDKQAQR